MKGVSSIVAVLGLLVAIGAIGYLVTTGQIEIPQMQTTGQEVGQDIPNIINQQNTQTNTNANNQPVTTGNPKPVETLKAIAKNKYTESAADDVEIRFYVPGADVKNPNVKALDTLAFDSNGEASSTAFVVNTETNYDVWANGSSTYYDELITEWTLSYNPDTGKGFLLFDAGQTFYPAIPIGTIVDQDSVPEKSTDFVDTGTDELTYNETTGGGSAWVKMDIGNSNANSELKDLTLCFVDSDGDMDGDEVTALTATYVSGVTKISLPGNLLGYWQDGMGSGAKSCVLIASQVGPSEKARWEITFTFDESNFASGEEFEIQLDDLGDYSARDYPSRNTKASNSPLTITTNV